MKKIALLLTAVFAIAAQSQATIRRVNNTAGISSVYSSLSTAIDAANPGDTLHIEGTNTFYGSPYITKRLIIIGPGFFHADTAANPNTQANKLAAYAELNFGPGSKGSVVQGMGLGGITVSDSFITLQRNLISGTVNLGNAGHSYGDTIRNNFFDGGAINNTSGTYQVKSLFIYNNLIVKESGTFMNVTVLPNTSGYFVNNTIIAVLSTNATTLSVQNFTFQNNIFGRVNFGTTSSPNSYQGANIFLNNIAKAGLPTGNNNMLNIDPVDIYVGWGSPGTGTYSTDARYKLKANSPALNAGVLNGTAVDCGAFGGPAPYTLSGMPPVPSIYQLSMPTQVNSGTPSISVSVGAASH